MVSFFAEIVPVKVWPPFHQDFNKPKAIVQGFFLASKKKVLRKVIHLKVNKKRN